VNANAEIEIAELCEAGRDSWRAFVDAHPHSTLFHDLRWLDAVEEAYRFRNVSLVALNCGRVCGVLPLTLAESPLLGRSLVSTAFAVGGGVLVEDEAAADALAREALALGRRLGVNYVELRGGPAPGAPYQAKSGVYAAFERMLPRDPGALLEWIPRRRRAEVRKALKLQEEGETSAGTVDDVRDLYRLYAEAMRAFGTPVMPRRFLESLKRRFGDSAEVSAVERRGVAVAALLSFWRRDRVMPYYVGAAREAREIRAYDLLYYRLMQRAVERGVAIFDFGRSRAGSSQYDAKTYWGFEAAPLTYHVGLVRAKAPPNVNPDNPKFKRLVSIWRRLPPPVANALGPVIARNFP
jgi:FemAB-related protein (PEP-CTERM system-associated)